MKRIRNKLFVLLMTCTVVFALSMCYLVMDAGLLRIDDSSLFRFKHFNRKTSDGVQKPLFVIGILSAESNILRRDATRNTWLTLISNKLPLDVKYKFVLDNPTLKLEKENDEHHDIVYLNLTSSGYANKFGEKMYVWLKYAIRNYPEAALVAKMDDDVFLCVPGMFDRIHSILNETLYYGYRYSPRRLKLSLHSHHDEMFVVVGRVLVDRILKRRLCDMTNPKKSNCVKDVDLLSYHLGGNSLSEWLSKYDDIDIKTDIDLMTHLLTHNMKLKVKLYNLAVMDYCENNVLFHKAMPGIMYRLHYYSSIVRTEEAISSLPPFMISNRFRTMPAIAEIHKDVVLKRDDHTVFCEYWMVMQQNYSKNIDNLRRISRSLTKWCIVIILMSAEENRNDFFFDKKVVLLTLAKQEKMFGVLSEFTPWSSIARKNIGYMYAIYHGAKYILDIPAGSILSDSISIVSNEYPQKQPCDRKFTLNLERYFPKQSEKFKRGASFNSQDQTGVGALYLTSELQSNDQLKASDIKLPENCYSLLPKNEFPTLNMRVTLWTREVFPYIALPVSFNYRISQYFRNDLMKFFLDKKNIRIIISREDRKRNETRSMHFASDVRNIYDKKFTIYRKLLIEVLHELQLSADDISMEGLYTELYKRGFLGYQDLNSIRAWTRTIEASLAKT